MCTNVDTNIYISQRIFSRCKHKIEDEVHMLFDCSAYEIYRPKVDILKPGTPYKQSRDKITRVFICNFETTMK